MTRRELYIFIKVIAKEKKSRSAYGLYTKKNCLNTTCTISNKSNKFKFFLVRQHTVDIYYKAYHKYYHKNNFSKRQKVTDVLRGFR